MNSNKFFAGASSEMQVFHDGTNSVIKDTRNSGKVRIQADDFDVIDKDASETMLSATVDGAVSLNYNGSTKLATKSDGVNITGELECDSLDIDGNIDIHATRISYDTSSEHLKFLDNIELVFGNGNDLQIYHDGTNSVIDNNTGDLNITTTGSGDDIYMDAADDIYLRVQGNESGVSIIGNGAVELYHNNSKKLETTSSGVTVTGTVAATSYTGDGAALTGVGGENDITSCLFT